MRVKHKISNAYMIVVEATTTRQYTGALLIDFFSSKTVAEKRVLGRRRRSSVYSVQMSL